MAKEKSYKLGYCIAGFLLGCVVMLMVTSMMTNETNELNERGANKLDAVTTHDNKINCSEFHNAKNTEGFYGNYYLIGCVFTELHEQNPDVTQEIMDKYALEVTYDGFLIERENNNLLLNNTQSLTLAEDEEKTMLCSEDMISLCVTPDIVVDLGNNTYGLKLYPRIEDKGNTFLRESQKRNVTKRMEYFLYPRYGEGIAYEIEQDGEGVVPWL